MTVRKITSFTAALAMAATAIGVAAPAQARDHGRYDHRYEQRSDRYDRYGRYDARDRYDYGRAGYRDQYRNDYRYRGQRCSDGATGTVLGAIAGGLIGNSAAGRNGDKTAGTIIGGAIGAVAGRAIDKGSDGCR